MKIAANIWKLHLLKGIMWFMVAMPIIVLFFQEHGLSLTEVMILQSLYSITVALFEIPSGYIADLFGRKRMIILSTVFCFIGYLILSNYSSFYFFALAEILIGIGGSLMSGSDSAILYDTLLESGSRNQYTKIEGRNYAIGNFSEATAGILGGILAASSIYLPVYIQTIVLFFSIPIAFTIVEPSMHKENPVEKSFEAIKNIFKYALFEFKKLKWLIFYSSVMGVATLSIAWLAQPFFKNIDIPIIYFGILWAILNFSVGISSYNAHLIERKFKPINLMILIAVIISTCFLGVGLFNSLTGLLFMLLIYIMRGLVTPVMRNYININISSNQRATVLSIRSLLIRLGFAIIAPLLGYLTDKTDISYAFYLLALLIILLGLLSTSKLSKLD